MPELPEVETVRRGLQPALEGRRIVRAEVRRPDLRWPFPERMAERLTGARVEGIGRRSKYLLLDLDTGETLLVHLGMSGRMLVGGRVLGEYVHDVGAEESPHDHVVLDTEDGTRITFNDARRFGAMDLWPTGDLLDQRLVAGLGNIYVSEALSRAGIHPARAAGRISLDRLRRLAPAIRAVLEEAIEAGGSTLRDHRQADGAAGRFQDRFRAYDRAGQPCLTSECQGTVRRIVQGGRSTYYCPACQR
jgi:formamidopyrimidine-DNA glycosylase